MMTPMHKRTISVSVLYLSTRVGWGGPKKINPKFVDVIFGWSLCTITLHRFQKHSELSALAHRFTFLRQLSGALVAMLRVVSQNLGAKSATGLKVGHCSQISIGHFGPFLTPVGRAIGRYNTHG